MLSMKNKKIAISGVGIVSNLGFSKESYWAGRNDPNGTATKIENFDTSKYLAKKAYGIKNFKAKEFINRRIIKTLDQVTRYCVSSTGMAIKDSEVKADKSKMAIITGSKFHGIHSIFDNKSSLYNEGIDGVSPLLFPGTVFNASGGQAAIEWNITGPNCVINSGLASGLSSINKAIDYIRLGKVEAAVAGGNEMLHEFIHASYNSQNMLSFGNNGDEKIKPFDKKANGLILGEGACFFTLEPLESIKSRNGNVYAEIVSYDHAFCPDLNNYCEDLTQLISKTLISKETDYTQLIDLVVSDACGNSKWDYIQAKAIKNAFKKYKPSVTSNKSSIGHTLGASGAFNTLDAVLSIENDEIAPIYNLQEPEVDLNYVTSTVSKKINYALVISFDPDGNMATLLLKKSN